MENKIVGFLKELRDSTDIMHAIFVKGSCYRLFSMLQKLFPQANPYWSDRENHCITEIDGKYYDIGGEVSEKHIKDYGYYLVAEEYRNGYYLLKWKQDENLRCYITTEKYI